MELLPIELNKVIFNTFFDDRFGFLLKVNNISSFSDLLDTYLRLSYWYSKFKTIEISANCDDRQMHRICFYIDHNKALDSNFNYQERYMLEDHLPYIDDYELLIHKCLLCNTLVYYDSECVEDISLSEWNMRADCRWKSCCMKCLINFNKSAICEKVRNIVRDLFILPAVSFGD